MDEIPKDLLENYKQKIPEKLKVIRQLIKGYSKAPTEEHKNELFIHVHKFAGSAGTYGFDTISVLLKEMEVKVVALTANSEVLSLESYLNSVEKEVR